MARYAKLALTIRRYNRDGETIEKIPLSSITLAPTMIEPMRLEVPSSSMLNVIGTWSGRLDYLVIINHSPVTVQLQYTTYTDLHKNTLTIPAARGDDSPGLLVVPDVSVSDDTVDLQAESDTAAVEIFAFQD